MRFAYDHGGDGRFYYAEIAGGGGALFDYDGDGWLDLYLTQGAPLPGTPARSLRNALYRNRGAGAAPMFEEVTARTGVDGVRAGRKVYCIGCAVGDIDADGRLDLFVTGFGGCLLYRNMGDGSFREVAREAGIRDTRFGTSAAFLDYDRDGRLDLLVCEYVDYRLDDPIRCEDARKRRDYCQPDYYPPAAPRLYRNLGGSPTAGARFRDVTASAGLTRPCRALGVVVGDVDDDGWPDLYLAGDKTPNLLYMNRGGRAFREEAVSRGCALSPTGLRQSGMGVDMRDVDGDLRPDIVVTNYWMESNNLYRNLGSGVFADQAAVAGVGSPNMRQVAFGAGLQDLNNDGWPDLFITNGHVLVATEFATPGAPRAQTDQLFLNLGAGRFQEVSDRAGPWFRTAHVGRAAAFGDLDNDGDRDVLLVPNEGPVALLLNEGGEGGARAANWLQFRLRGRRSNRDGIGARVEVTANGRVQRDEVRSAYSYCAASDLRLHFGLGTATRADRVEIRWPGGEVQTFTGVAANRIYEVVEGEKLGG